MLSNPGTAIPVLPTSESKICHWTQYYKYSICNVRVYVSLFANKKVPSMHNHKIIFRFFPCVNIYIIYCEFLCCQLDKCCTIHNVCLFFSIYLCNELGDLGFGWSPNRPTTAIRFHQRTQTQSSDGIMI